MYSPEFLDFCRVNGVDCTSRITHLFYRDTRLSDCGPLGENGAALCSDSAAPGSRVRIPVSNAHYLLRHDELTACAKVFRGFGYIAAAVAMEARAAGLQKTK